MKQKEIPMGLVLVGLIVVVVAAYLLFSTPRPSGEIPMSVVQKYDSIEQQYPGIFFLELSLCENNDRSLYVVTEGHGYVGTHYYFSAAGASLGSFEYDDMIEPNEPAPPYDLSQYTCTVLKEKKAGQ